MKLSVMNPVLAGMSFEDACAYLEQQGVEAVEIGCGGFPGKAHCDPDVLLHDEAALNAFRDTLSRHHLAIAALSTHGNAVHPDKAIAAAFHRDFENAVLLAEKLGVETVVTFSGCPGGCAEDKTPNWVTCPWPDDFTRILDYQWNKVLIPYWKKTAAFAESHGIRKIAFEMHPGFCVYNPETLMKLRNAVSPILGANVDPSHLFWQGINPADAIRYLKDAVFYFHAKDTFLNQRNIGINGVLDTKNYGLIPDRSWVFRTVGYGHDAAVWKDIMSALQEVGYEGAVSIEHEDGLMSGEEGLKKAITFMKQVIISDKPGVMYWA